MLFYTSVFSVQCKVTYSNSPGLRARRCIEITVEPQVGTYTICDTFTTIIVNYSYLNTRIRFDHDDVRLHCRSLALDKSHCFGQRFYCLHSSETLLGRLQCPLLALVPLCPPRSFALGKYCGGSLAMSSRSGYGYDFRVPAYVHYLHSVGSLVMSMILTL